MRALVAVSLAIIAVPTAFGNAQAHATNRCYWGTIQNAPCLTSSVSPGQQVTRGNSGLNRTMNRLKTNGHNWQTGWKYPAQGTAEWSPICYSCSDMSHANSYPSRPSDPAFMNSSSLTIGAWAYFTF